MIFLHALTDLSDPMVIANIQYWVGIIQPTDDSVKCFPIFNETGSGEA
jgi:hypothetical protein